MSVMVAGGGVFILTDSGRRLRAEHSVVLMKLTFGFLFSCNEKMLMMKSYDLYQTPVEQAGVGGGVLLHFSST